MKLFVKDLSAQSNFKQLNETSGEVVPNISMKYANGSWIKKMVLNNSIQIKNTVFGRRAVRFLVAQRRKILNSWWP